MPLSDECREFYELRNRRTVEYVEREVALSFDALPAAHVEVDAASAQNGPGQLALLALVNQLARVNRRITIAAVDVPVMVRTPFAGRTLHEVLLATAREIDPCGEFAIAQRPSDEHVAIGIGAGVAEGFDWYIGADRAVAELRRRPLALAQWAGTMRGAALASCLGAAAVFRTMLKMEVRERRLSAWNYLEGAAAAFGPESMERVNVGRVLMVGAGAVGAAVAYWLHVLGVNGDGWAVVDGDAVELHNTNRGLAFRAREAGWPTEPGGPRGEAVNKAKLIAPLIAGATAHDRWYHEAPELRDRAFDIVLALANDHAVRERLTQRHAAIAFQATTGENWLSQLHRHVLGRDGCIWCRTGEVAKTVFGCAGDEVTMPDGTRSDAALPFLSAASGLMLVTALQRLGLGEMDLDAEPENCWSWYFGSEHRMAATPAPRPCKEDCAHGVSSALRKRLTAGTRWASLVG